MFCNMYQFIIRVYITLASINFSDYYQHTNQFILTFNLYSLDFIKIIKFIAVILNLNWDLKLKVNGHKVFLYIYIHTFTGDMPQQ